MINATNPSVSNQNLPPPSLDEEETSVATGANIDAAAETQSETVKPAAEQGISALEYDANFTTTRDPSSADNNQMLMINPNSVNPNATRANVQDQMEVTSDKSAATSTESIKIARGATPAQVERSKQIDHGNFDSISASRKNSLDAKAETLILKNSVPKERNVYSEIETVTQDYREMSYNNYKGVMEQLRDNKSYSDKEKAYIWTQVADAKGKPTLFDGFNSGKVKPTLDGVNPAVIDQDRGRRLDTPNHTVVGFNEGYHGFGPDGKGGRGMGYDTAAKASARIDEHERNENPVKAFIVGNKYNWGDANASKAMVASFHAYRDAPEGSKFAAFANKWIDGMIAK